jgi:hypothetical protein
MYAGIVAFEELMLAALPLTLMPHVPDASPPVLVGTLRKVLIADVLLQKRM